LREPAATLAAVARETEATVLAVDLPSGVDADSGAVADADVVTFVDDVAATAALQRPGADDDKYTRGVVGVSAGSERYPGAAVLATAGARHGLAGYVRFSGPAYRDVVVSWPDVVAGPGRVGVAGRAHCWVVGSGRGTDEDGRLAVLDAAALDVPLLLDADALTVLADDAEVRAAIVARDAVTVLTPHDGEFARITGRTVGDDRLAAARAAAAALRCVVLLKGSSTVVAAPSGAAYVALAAPAELATAGSGDVLAGFAGSLLAHHQAAARLDDEVAARLLGVAAHVHGVAGVIAVGEGRTITASDVARALPDAVARVRRAV
jgi:hydroxyethylthiazole kinase-like uncharacterized protein yjeF